MKSFILSLALLSSLTAPLFAHANDLSTEEKAQLRELQERAQAWGQDKAEIRERLLQRQGGSDAGGGNFVGDELFDDYENKGSEKISVAELSAAADIYLKPLEAKMPSFAKMLRKGIKGTTWYLEPKEMAQTGACLNQTTLSVNRVVRACQSKLAVRIDKEFIKANQKSFPALVIHELLVYQMIHRTSDPHDVNEENYHPDRINDEGVREVSRAIRNPDITESELQTAVKRAGFGSFRTSSDIRHVNALFAKYEAALAQRTKKFCANPRAGQDDKKLEDAVNNAKWALPQEEEDFERRIEIVRKNDLKTRACWDKALGRRTR
ncbi:hypothetical protein AZI86_00995 [Bdellovibrio bacteriovorus]|uniref:Uncharacterized protein n=1 Tax=Bdellovibrio bacteriovorus TaxID=959 RepID=A0A150WMF3_BDEBC|nr:hypothetical protein [Bdellovibrio bacteriovorus]KYG65683.1 hypothetical protein AZI86_00995 [Bdellovibrio bacteriovorus]